MIVFVVIDMIIIFCCCLRELKIKNINRFTNSIIIIIFFSLSGLAYKVHNDYFIYELIYPEINFFNFTLTANFENGYAFLNAVFNKFLSFYQFKAFIYFINVTLIYNGIKKIANKKLFFPIIMFLYLDMHFFPIYLSAFRQSISVSIFIYSLHWIEKNKFLKYVIAIMIASLFHKSALVLFIVYPLIKIIKINTYWIKIYGGIYLLNKCMPIFISVSIWGIKFLSKYFSVINLSNHYFQPKLYARPSTVSAFLVVLLLIVFAKIPKSDHNIFIIKCFILYMLFSMFGSIFPIFFRIEVYLAIFMILGMLLILDSIENNYMRRGVKILTLIFFILIYNLRFIYLYNKESGVYIPFHFSIETLYKDIPYETTSEYKHVIDRYKTADIDNLKNRIKKEQML